MSDDMSDRQLAATTRQADFKMTALRSYVRRAAKPAPLDALEALSPVSSVALDTEDREELTRSLGVPSSVLDDMLSKLND